MNDYVIVDIAVHLAASKNQQYRRDTVLWYRTLAEFLQENNLLTRSVLAPNQDPQPPFRIMQSDLTEEGDRLITAALDKWLRGLSAGKWLSTDATLLKKELKKLRGSRERQT